MYDIKLVDKATALKMVKQYHYSNTLPKINKYFVGFFIKDKLVGLVTLGWGTRPLHTIKKLFPSLDTKDYLEIGRMCMIDSMPRNSESQMLSKLIKYVKRELPHIKLIFTWSDGMLGKPGFVYQAANFLYAGYSMTDTYLINGVKIHPRQTRALLSPGDKRLTVRPTNTQLHDFGIKHYKGKQLKYLYFICGKKERKRLMDECLSELSRNYPKLKDLSWRVKDNNGKWIDSKMPGYITDTVECVNIQPFLM